jgi:hypothetical protein
VLCIGARQCRLRPDGCGLLDGKTVAFHRCAFFGFVQAAGPGRASFLRQERCTDSPLVPLMQAGGDRPCGR